MLALLSARVERVAEAAFGQDGRISPDGVWQEIELQQQAEKSAPATARFFRLNRAALRQALERAPMETRTSLTVSEEVLTLPMPDGSFARFRIEDSPVMEPGLAARFPEIKSYRGQGLDKNAMTMRCDWSPNGFHALVLSGHQTVNIHPINAGESDVYATYFGNDIQPQDTQCLTGEIQKINPGEARIAGPLVSVGPTLRTYRIAIATTWEYSNSYGGGTNAGTVASLNTWLNSANAIYERELAIHLNLVNDTDIFYTTERGFSAGTDPFTNSNVSTMLSEVRPVLRDQVGQANYDLGHVLGLAGSGASGIAFIGVICDNTNQGGLGPLKGGGATMVSGAAGNSLALGVWIHELGHQFGANHNFNGTASNCSQRNAATAYESGSGVTIMAYSGICGADNIATSRDMRFHATSYAEITNYIISGTGSTCDVTSATGNTAPTINGGSNFTIPRNTPFTLTATGGDADAGDVPNLTYAWEQIDSGGASFPQNGTSASYNDAADPQTTTRPIFRPRPVSPSPSRTFPSLTYILNNANDPPDTVGGLQTAEELPRIARTLNFRAVIRDNRANGGGVNEDTVQLTVASSGPFLVTAPNTAVTWTGGGTQTVTWSVNGTSGAPVSAASVRILLSTDGGQTFPTTLLASTPNDGTQSITVPNSVLSSTARVRVEAIGNIFFDISDTNFSITPGDSCPVVTGIGPQAGNVGTTVIISGTNFTSATAVRFSNNVNASFTINSSTQITALVPVGAVTGPITISKTGCSDVQTGPFSVFPLPPVTLSVDDGSYETASNYGSSGIVYFVNRLTPASYPATLSQVSIYFASFTNVTAGTPITIVAGANADGDANINNTSFQTLNTTAGTVNQFNNYPITPVIINSGDFVVGFGIAFSSGQFPALRDTTAPNMGRSYASTNGTTFSTIDSLGFAGDIPIRAQVFVVGGGGCTYSLAPTSQNFVAAGGSNSVTVTTTVGCMWTATSNAGWITINSGSSGIGSGTVNYTVAANTGPQRTGTMTIAGQTFTVTQNSGCPGITVNPATLPNGTIGTAYNQTISATGGTGPYTFAVISGALPSGLGLSTAGALTGTPAASGTSNFTVQATAANGCTGTRAYTIQINCQTLAVNPASLSAGTAGTAYSQVFTHSGGIGTVNFSLTGTLPAGLSFNAGTATLSGTPTQTGTFNNIVVTATDSNNCTGSRTYSLVINCPAITVNPATLSAGTAGVSYSQTFTRVGGVGTVNFSLTGTLPAGLSFNAGTATLSGTPAQTGTFNNIIVTATDSNNCTGSRTYSLVINCPAITVNPATLNAGTAGVGYSQTFTRVGGVGAVNFSLTGTLPAGLSFNAGTATLSGTPTQTGTFNSIIVTATDSNNCTGSRTYSLVINCPTITVNPATLPNATIGQPYSQQLSQTGGVGAITWSRTGTLPNNVTLNASGLLSGTPTASGNFTFTIRATDANACFGERQYTVNVSNCPVITISPNTLPGGVVGAAYNQSLSASGGTPGYTFTLNSGALPSNVNLSSAGVLSGTPNAAGAFTFTVKATDQAGCMATKQYTVIICATITVNPSNPALPAGTVGTFYSQTFTQTGGAGTTTWSSTGTLPSGLALGASTGVLSGTPTTAGPFNFTIRATDANGCFGERQYTININSGTVSGLQFYPLAAPIRLLDTRAGQTGCDAPGSPIAGGTSRTQTAAGRTCGSLTIPATARALTGNITTVQSGGGYLTLYPSDAAQPLVANSNYGPNEIVNNVFTVGLGAADGAFKIFVQNTTDVVVDVTGYYAPPGAGGLYFHPLPKPVRLLETRPGFTGCFNPGAPLPGNVDTTQQARGPCDGVTIPTAAQAIVGNATTVNPQGTGFLFTTLFPADAPRPVVASSNYLPGQVMNAPFTVGLSAAGAFKIYPTTQTDLVIDVLGYYSPEANDVNGAGLLFNPLPKPVRLLETRAGFTGCFLTGVPLLAGSIRTQPARGLCDGVTIAANARSIIGNATVVLPQSGGYLTFWPSDAAQPTVAASNFAAGQVFNRHFTVGLGNADGAFKIFTSATTDLVIDVSGFFAP